MYGVLGEDPSDTATLKVLIRRLAGSEAIPVKTKGYSGCGEMLRKGARQLRLFADLACRRFVVCHDADGPEPAGKYSEVYRRIVQPSGVGPWCVVIPVQELEA